MSITWGDFLYYNGWALRNMRQEIFPHYLEPEFISQAKAVIKIIIKEEKISWVNQLICRFTEFLHGFEHSLITLPLSTHQSLGQKSFAAFKNLCQWFQKRRTSAR